MPGTTDLPLLGADERPPALLPEDPHAKGAFGQMIQHINITRNLGREQLFELGRKGPYHRYVSFPVELSTEIRLLPAPTGCV